MIKLMIKETRPNIDINFFQYDQDINQYIQNNFINTGKLVFKNEVISYDQLTKITVLDFLNDSANSSFFNDKILSFQFNVKKDYNQYYNIDYVHTYQTGLIPLVIGSNVR